MQAEAELFTQRRKIAPERFQAIQPLEGRTPHRRVADQKRSAENVWPRLQQCVEGTIAGGNEWVRRRGRVDRLERQDVHRLVHSWQREMRQVRMQVEGGHTA